MVSIIRTPCSQQRFEAKMVGAFTFFSFRIIDVFVGERVGLLVLNTTHIWRMYVSWWAIKMMSMKLCVLKLPKARPQRLNFITTIANCSLNQKMFWTTHLWSCLTFLPSNFVVTSSMNSNLFIMWIISMLQERLLVRLYHQQL